VGLSLAPADRPVTYTFVAPIAQGGMGYVELCFRREGRFLRWCARKRLHQHFRGDPRFRSMFVDEARLAGLVRHPNVVGVSDVGEDEDGPYLIMDYVEGVSLSKTIREIGGRQSIPMQVALRICLDVAMGLHAAHEVRSEDGTILHLVHRDVSPQNILIGFDGTVRVTDFGIAKALGNASQTNTGVLKGNMGYLSPEQLQFQEADRRSDFFSLGVTLYEMLSGARLYPNKDGFDGTRRILSEPPPDIGEIRSDVPPELVELLFEMLSKEPEARPPNALEIANRLEGILAPLIAEEGSLTVADHMEQHFAEHRERHRAVLTEHVKRIDAQAAVTLRSIPLIPTTETATKKLQSLAQRSRSKWVVTGALAVVAVASLAFLEPRLRGTRASSASVLPSPEVASVRSPSPTVVQPQTAQDEPRPPARTELAKLRDVAPPTHAKRGKRLASHHTRSALKNSDHDQKKGPAVESGGGEGGHLAVPLFTKWR
jgi:serine/threonine protein kinase